MKNKTQFTSINNPTSETLNVRSGVPQGSILGPLLFLIYINNMHLVTEHANMHHFGDDTSLLYEHKSIKKINQIINFEMKKIVHWVGASKISLNSSKTEIIIFKSKKNKITKNLNFRVGGQNTITKTHSKYLGAILDESLSVEYHKIQIKQSKWNISETSILCNQ